MTKHTPGPWNQKWSENTGWHIYSTTVAGERGLICELEDDFDEATRESNARLIAAAPDLLAALIELQQWAEYNGIPEGTGEIALAVITKATQ